MSTMSTWILHKSAWKALIGLIGLRVGKRAGCYECENEPSSYTKGGEFNNNNNIYLLQLGCHPVAVVILHVNRT